jgi:hypothetical protein
MFVNLIGEFVVMPAQNNGATFSIFAFSGIFMANSSDTTILFE